MALGTSMNTAFRYIGQTLGAPLAGALLSTFVASYTIGNQVLSLPTRDAFRYCFYIGSAAFVVVGLVSILAREVIEKKAEARAQGLKNMDTPILKGTQVFHNFIKPHEGLGGKTPAEAAGIKVEGDDKWKTLIQNAKLSEKGWV
jgi:hypothetical protein